MALAIESFLDNLVHTSDRFSVWEATRNFVENLGFSDCSLVTANKTNGKLSNPKTMTSFSDEFRHAYENEGIGEIDPFLHFHCFDMLAKKIVATDLSSFPNGSPIHMLFLDHVMEIGACGGLGVPVRTIDQETFGGWIMSSSESEAAVDLLRKEHWETLQLISILAYERMSAVGFDTVHQRLLSERERECLLWLCAGLRVSMISEKLKLSESAINLYISNAKAKLGAKTREQAIARAILTNEIQL